MKPAQFRAIVTARIDVILRTLAAKGAEYAPGADVLHNFKCSAELANEVGLPESTPARECFGFMRKHLVSIADICNRETFAHMGLEDFRAMLDEKVGDAINYLILMYACLVDQHKPALFDALRHCIADIGNHP